MRTSRTDKVDVSEADDTNWKKRNKNSHPLWLIANRLLNHTRHRDIRALWLRFFLCVPDFHSQKQRRAREPRMSHKQSLCGMENMAQNRSVEHIPDAHTVPFEWNVPKATAPYSNIQNFGGIPTFASGYWGKKRERQSKKKWKRRNCRVNCELVNLECIIFVDKNYSQNRFFHVWLNVFFSKMDLLEINSHQNLHHFLWKYSLNLHIVPSCIHRIV